MEPAYLKAIAEGRLDAALSKAWARMRNCDLCPRLCGVDRTRGEKGFCRTGKRALLSGAAPHFGEEAPLVGRGGSGTVFFGGCNLLCRFCQNWETSRGLDCEEADAPRLARIMLGLQARGCHNLNLVTPSHVVPQILSALRLAARKGFHLPLVYNTGGYDSMETLRLLDGVVDIYMPDLKTASAEWAGRLFHAPDYWDRAREAAREMRRQVGDLVIDADGVARRGLLVRHLVMPGGVSATEEVMRFVAEELSPGTYVNVMAQYRPVGEAHGIPPVDRAPTREECRRAVAAARAAGLTRLDRG